MYANYKLNLKYACLCNLIKKDMKGYHSRPYGIIALFNRVLFQCRRIIYTVSIGILCTLVYTKLHPASVQEYVGYDIEIRQDQQSCSCPIEFHF